MVKRQLGKNSWGVRGKVHGGGGGKRLSIGPFTSEKGSKGKDFKRGREDR